VGLILATMTYDGLGRRITRVVTNSDGPSGGGANDYAYHYYYLGQSIAEVRNGSNLVAKQMVWAGPSGGGAGGYIDELVEVKINQDPTDATEQLCERAFYSLHNAQYNVLGMVMPTLDGNEALIGQRLVERYAYTPYGQRSVFSHGWVLEDLSGNGVVDGDDEDIVSNHWGSSDPRADLDGSGSVGSGDLGMVLSAHGESLPTGDPLVTTAADHSFRDASGIALNEIGHQGLPHDEESGIVQNRARDLIPPLGRFAQRDPLGYVDGMSVYAYYVVLTDTVDPSGLVSKRFKKNWGSTIIAGKFAGTISPRSATVENTESTTSISWRPPAEDADFGSLGKFSDCVDEVKFVQIDKSGWITHIDTIRDRPWKLDNEEGNLFYDNQHQKYNDQPLSSMTDDPGFNHDRFPYYFADFETCAVVSKGLAEGYNLGCIRWGHHFEYNYSYKFWGVKRYIGAGSNMIAVSYALPPERAKTARLHEPIIGDSPTSIFIEKAKP
jgi:RHS repeat-associated protein